MWTSIQYNQGEGKQFKCKVNSFPHIFTLFDRRCIVNDENFFPVET